MSYSIDLEFEPDPIAGVAASRQAFLQRLHRVGAYLVRKSKQQFTTRKGWDRRYPNQTPFVINLAGAITDFNRGQTHPKNIRFQAQPVGTDTGATKASVSYKLVGSTLTVAAAVDYADRFAEGGTSTIPITEGGRRRARKWAFRNMKTRNHAARLILAVTKGRVLTTSSPPRPLLFVTPEIVDTVRAMIEFERIV